MKNKNVPSPEEIKKLLSEAERVVQLDDELNLLHSQLREKQDEIRKRVSEYLNEVYDPNGSLEKLLAKYGRQRSSGNYEVSRLVADQVPLMTKIQENRKGRTEIFPRLKKRVGELSAQVIATKQAEYDALIKEISAKLSPYCGEDEQQANWLSQQTVAATTLFSAFSRCNPIIYAADNLITPLRSILEVINS